MARKEGEKLDITATLGLLLVITTHALARVALDKAVCFPNALQCRSLPAVILGTCLYLLKG